MDDQRKAHSDLISEFTRGLDESQSALEAQVRELERKFQEEMNLRDLAKTEQDEEDAPKINSDGTHSAESVFRSFSRVSDGGGSIGVEDAGDLNLYVDDQGEGSCRAQVLSEFPVLRPVLSFPVRHYLAPSLPFPFYRYFLSIIPKRVSHSLMYSLQYLLPTSPSVCPTSYK